MKTQVALYIKDGVLYVNEFPIEPEKVSEFKTRGGLHVYMGGDWGYGNLVKKYLKELDQAKSTAIKVRLEDQKFARKLVCDHHSYLDKPEVVYPIPGLKFTHDWINPCIKNKDCLNPKDGHHCSGECKALYLEATLIFPPEDKQNDEWQASPKKKLPLSERLDKLSKKLKATQERGAGDDCSVTGHVKKSELFLFYEWLLEANSCSRGEILNELQKRLWLPVEKYPMQEYSDQNLAEYKRKLKQAFPDGIYSNDEIKDLIDTIEI